MRAGQFPQLGAAQTTNYLSFFASDQFGPAIYWDPTKDMRFGRGGASLYNPFGFTEQMRIQSSTGNVGIATQSPGSKLDVAGDINFSGKLRYQNGLMLSVPTAQNGINLGLGVATLVNNTTGYLNTALGNFALANNTTGPANTAVGAEALEANTTGCCNTAMGPQALWHNTIGDSNTAIGMNALSLNNTGYDNTATGNSAMEDNTTGNNNTAQGVSALQQNTSGAFNTAIGVAALNSSIFGNNNTALGAWAGYNVNGGSNNIHIGNEGFAGDNATIRIGNVSGGFLGTQTSFFATGIRGATTAHNDAVPVMIDSAGQLGTISSSRRFKEDIHDMGDASSDLMRLRPVTYRYKQPFADGSKPVQYGLIAEEVAEVYPDLVAHSADGQIETVKYQVLDSMLLNEIQRLQAEIKKLEERLAKVEGKP